MANEFRDIIVERAKAGVRVLFLVDAFGSTLKKEYMESLEQAGDFWTLYALWFPEVVGGRCREGDRIEHVSGLRRQIKTGQGVPARSIQQHLPISNPGIRGNRNREIGGRILVVSLEKLREPEELMGFAGRIPAPGSLLQTGLRVGEHGGLTRCDQFSGCLADPLDLSGIAGNSRRRTLSPHLELTTSDKD